MPPPGPPRRLGSAPPIWRTPDLSDQPHPLHAGMPVLADDDVVVHGYPERAGDIDDRFCHLDIRA
jgi:hypothetical protein